MVKSLNMQLLISIPTPMFYNVLYESPFDCIQMNGYFNGLLHKHSIVCNQNINIEIVFF